MAHLVFQFVSPEPGLVTFNHPSSFLSLNDPAEEKNVEVSNPRLALVLLPSLTLCQLQSYVESVVDSLFCSVVTSGVVPSVVCRRSRSPLVASGHPFLS
jgi:hypothetical protein